MVSNAPDTEAHIIRHCLCSQLIIRFSKKLLYITKCIIIIIDTTIQPVNIYVVLMRKMPKQ